PVLVYAPDIRAYGRLSRLITVGRRSAEKGECHLRFADVAEHAEGLLASVILPPVALTSSDPLSTERTLRQLLRYRDVFRERCHLAVSLHRGAEDDCDLDRFVALSRRARLPLVATNDVHYHDPARRALHDVLTAIQHGVPVAELGERLAELGEVRF